MFYSQHSAVSLDQLEGGTGIVAGSGDLAKQQQSSLNWDQMTAGGGEECGIQQCFLPLSNVCTH